MDDLPYLNHTFKTALTTFLRYKTYIINAIELPYSNTKLEATNKLIKDIKRNSFGYHNFENLKRRIYIPLNIKKREDEVRLLSCLIIGHPLQLTKSQKKKRIKLTFFVCIECLLHLSKYKIKNTNYFNKLYFIIKIM